MNESVSDAKTFFERVAMDWEVTRLAYYDERVIEKVVNAELIEGEKRPCLWRTLL